MVLPERWIFITEYSDSTTASHPPLARATSMAQHSSLPAASDTCMNILKLILTAKKQNVVTESLKASIFSDHWFHRNKKPNYELKCKLKILEGYVAITCKNLK